MIINYFAYACIYGCDVGAEATDTNEKLLKDIPEKTLKTHLLIQEKLEVELPRIKEDYLQIAEEQSRR